MNSNAQNGLSQGGEQLPSDSKETTSNVNTQVVHSASSASVPLRENTSGTGVQKRNSEYCRELIRKKFKIAKPVCTEEVLGPLYESDENSIILFNPLGAERFHKVKNPNGFVPVVLNKYLQNGKDEELPQLLKQEQIEGIQFLWNSFYNEKGVILAHEMGLGKTRTTIAFLLTILKQSERCPRISKPGAEKILILAPKNAILATWETEIEKWCPKDIEINHISIHSGTNPKRVASVIQNFENGGVQIVILSYDTFKKYRGDFYGFGIDVLVCDEAHLLKNDLTQRSQMLQKLDTKFRIGLTGTPFQNTLDEFCNLVNFFRPNVFEVDYKRKYCSPIQNQRKKDKQLNEYTRNLLDELKNKASAVLQYRKNSIPVAKHEFILCIGLQGKVSDNLPNVQEALYEALTGTFKQKTVSLNFYQKMDILKKQCIHPKYAFKTFARHQCLSEVTPLYENKHVIVDDITGGNKLCYYLLFSGKISLLFDMLKSIREKHPGEKAIIASYSVELLQYINEICKSDVMKDLDTWPWKCLQYDGNTGEKDRESVLKKFQAENDYFLLLLGGKAGGTALNLTSANHLFLLDPDWNPSNDKQVLARIYRPGQTKTVKTYRLLSTGTIEESIFLSQLSKDEMGDDLIAEASTGNLKLPFSEDDLLQYHSNTSSHLRDNLARLCEEAEDERSAAQDEGNGVELRYFAQELSLAKQYESADDLQGDELEILKSSWDQGITLAFHKITNPVNTIGEGIYNMVDQTEPLTVQVIKPKTSLLSGKNPKIYSIGSSPKGLVLIVNNKNYYFKKNFDPVENPSDSDYTRYGTGTDVRYLEHLFSQMGMKVILKEDIKDLNELECTLQDFKKELIQEKSDAALVLIMGHGVHGGLLMSKIIEVANFWSEIVFKFTNEIFPEMAGKPKGFFFQCCQKFVAYDVNGQSVAETLMEDIILSVAASPGSEIHRYEFVGGFYIYQLVSIFMKYAGTMDVTEMLDKLRDQMTRISKNQKQKQIPYCNNYLTKKLYLM